MKPFFSVLLIPLLQTLAVFSSDADHFRLKHPARLQVRSSAPANYEKDFDFVDGTLHPLRLRLIDLSKYLPKTNTPTIKEYLQTFRTFQNYRETQIGGKQAFEYRLCGRAACTQEVVFIHGNQMFDFSIAVTEPEILAIVSSIEFDN